MKKLTIEECFELGGHFFIRSPTITMTNVRNFSRHCLHCGFTQVGVERTAIKWEDQR